jgi:hypothetical protein
VFVPVVGTAFFLFCNRSSFLSFFLSRRMTSSTLIAPTGSPGGSSRWHARYVELKGFSDAQKQAFVVQRSPAYTAYEPSALSSVCFILLTLPALHRFNLTATILSFIPLGGLVFVFTNTVGAALWAAQLEAEEQKAAD